MRKLLPLLLSLVILMISFPMDAKETKEEKNKRKQKEKLEQARLDSIDHQKAVNAINALKFTLMADRLVSKAHSRVVDDNMNFVSVTPKKGMLQVVPFYAGFNGVNLDGNVTNTKIEKLKNGDLNVRVDVFGLELRARITITLFKDSNSARAIISPSFGSGDITMYGKIFPTSVFPNLEKEMER